MADITFEELIQAVQKLTPQQKALLAQSLNEPSIDLTPTREELLAELEALRKTGAFKRSESLRNRYVNPAVDDLTDEQLSADIHEAATEWEQELDEFFGDEI
jgi:hypothetical protein